MASVNASGIPKGAASTFTEFLCSHIPRLDDKVKQDRDATLRVIEALVRKWVNELGENQKRQAQSPCFGCQTLPFGSYRMGLSTNDSDLDVIIVVPEFVTRESFFDSFLKTIRREESITEIRTVEGARVPLIQMRHLGTDVDLLFCQVNFPEVPCIDDLYGHDVLRHMDVTSMRSLNGVRETNLVMEVVPDVESFIQATRFIKYWAKCQGLHNASLGFLGGFALSILMAHICQTYPDCSLEELISTFFRVYNRWDWSEPVLLKPLSEDGLDLNPWNAKTVHGDSLQKMCIIAPAYPEHNVSFTVTHSTRTILKDHFKKADEIIEKIETGVAEWRELLKNEIFSTKYRTGLVASKIRSLVLSLERQGAVDLVHPFTKSIPAKDGERWLTRWLLGVQFVKTKGLRVDLETDIKKFDRSVYELAVERSIFREGMRTSVIHVKRNQLSELFPQEYFQT